MSTTRLLELVSVSITVVVAVPAVREEWKRLQERQAARQAEQDARDEAFYARQEAAFVALRDEMFRDLRISMGGAAA